MSRYPYTYAADYLRMKGPSIYPIKGVAVTSPTLCRSDASHLRRVIAEAIGMTDEELAKKLADAYLKEFPEEAPAQQINT